MWYRFWHLGVWGYPSNRRLTVLAILAFIPVLGLLSIAMMFRDISLLDENIRRLEKGI